MLCSDGVSVYLLKGAQFHGYVGFNQLVPEGLSSDGVSVGSSLVHYTISSGILHLVAGVLKEESLLVYQVFIRLI